METGELSHLRLQLALKAARQAAWGFDFIQGTGYRSPELQELLGVQNDHPSLQDYLRNVYVDDRPVLLQTFAALQSGTINESELQYRFVRDDGQIIWVEQHAYLERDEAGQPRGLYGLTRDITTAKQVELDLQQLNATLELRVAQRTQELEARTLALNSFANLTRDLTLEQNPLKLVGRAQEIVLGFLPPGIAAYYEQEDDVWQLRSHRGVFRNAKLLGVLQSGVSKGNSRNIEEPARTGEPLYQDDFDLQSIKTGQEFFEDIQSTAAFPVCVGPHLMGVLVFGIYQRRVWSVVEREVMETSVNSLGLAMERAQSVFQLAQSIEELRLANEELGAFSYSVSHDLKTPVRHIEGFAALAIQSQDDPAKLGHYLGIISQGAHRLNALIEALLSLSRIGRQELQFGTVNLTAVVEEVISEHVHLQADRDIEWRVSALPQVRGDEATLRLALSNLIENALKYTSTRARTAIEISSTAGEGFTTISVRDNGVGFDARYSDKLFRVFQRLHRNEEFSGTGIGLANVRRIVTRHGGTVSASSELGQGATFSFTLPSS